MGLFKTIFLLSGIPMRPTTGRERSRRYQREANDLLEEQLDAMQNLAQPQTPQAPSDTRPRGTCPACLEMMLQGASTCPHCHTTGITWQTETTQEFVETHKEQPNKAQKIYKARDVKNACYKCGGIAVLSNGGTVFCSSSCGTLEKGRYPQYFKKATDVKNACYKCGGIAVLEGSNVVCSSSCGILNKGHYTQYFKKATDVKNACYRCGGIAVLEGSNVVCSWTCGTLEKGRYPQYFKKATDVKNACYKCGGIAVLEGSNVVCSWTCGKLRTKMYPHLFPE